MKLPQIRLLKSRQKMPEEERKVGWISTGFNSWRVVWIDDKIE